MTRKARSSSGSIQRSSGGELERIEGECLLALLHDVGQVQVAMTLANGAGAQPLVPVAIEPGDVLRAARPAGPATRARPTSERPATRRSPRRGLRRCAHAEQASRSRHRPARRERRGAQRRADARTRRLAPAPGCRQRGARSRARRRRTCASARRRRPPRHRRRSSARAARRRTSTTSRYRSGAKRRLRRSSSSQQRRRSARLREIEEGETDRLLELVGQRSCEQHP